MSSIFKKLAYSFILVLAALGLLGITVFIYTYSKDKSTQAQETSSEEIDPQAIYNLVNDERQSAGLSRLSLNPLAQKAAEEKCADMVANDYYDHVNPVTGKHGYEFAVSLLPKGILFNENINQGNVLINKEFVQGWLDSPGHKATMLEPKFTDTGVAVCKIPSEPADSKTVVQEFIQIP